jgi:hypothetical protein
MTVFIHGTLIPINILAIHIKKMLIQIRTLKMILMMDMKRVTLTHTIPDIRAPTFLSGQQVEIGLTAEMHFPLLSTMVLITHGIMDTVIPMD